ncbi:MAG: chemotaxis protein CheW [Candidatus Thiodiazotropha sp.]
MSQALQISGQTHDDASQYLTFSVNNEEMAVCILDVDEIIEIGDMTRVPMSNRSIRGVINLRGNVVPVIDLSHRLGQGATEVTKRTCIILVNFVYDEEHQAMGLLVDEVNEILEISPDAIQKTPDFGTDIRQDFIGCIGRVDNRFIILLNIDRVLALDELSTNEQVALKHRGVPKLTDQAGE